MLSLKELLSRKEFADKNFDFDHIRKIEWGLRCGLTPEQIAMYADQKYNCSQMHQIGIGLMSGLTPEQIALYADQKYNCSQMVEIRLGFEAGLTPEQIALYTDKEFSGCQMAEIREGLEHALSVEQVTLYANSKYNWDQMMQIRKGMEKGLSFEQIAIYANEEFDSEQMYVLRLGLQRGLTLEQIALYADQKYEGPQMYEFMEGLIHGLTSEQIALYADEKYDCDQMRKIRKKIEIESVKESANMYIQKISKPKDAVRVNSEADIPEFLRDTIHVKNGKIVCLAAEGYNVSELGSVIGYDRQAPTATGKGAWPLGKDSYIEKDGIFYSSPDIRKAWILSDEVPDELRELNLPLTRNEDGSWTLISKWGAQTNRNEVTKEVLNALVVKSANGEYNILSEGTSSYDDYMLCTEKGEVICKLCEADIFDRNDECEYFADINDESRTNISPDNRNANKRDAER